MKKYLIIIALLFSANLKAQTYGTAGISWGLNGNRILDRNYIGTNNLAPLNFKTSGSLAGYFDTDQSLYLLNVPDSEDTDSVLSINNGQVRKIPFESFYPSSIVFQNGLNGTYGAGEIGGFLLRATAVDTKSNYFGFFNSTEMNVGSNRASTFGVSVDINPLQNQQYRNFNVQTNLSHLANNQSELKNFIVINQFAHSSLPAQSWGESPIINVSNGIDRAILNKDNDSTSSRIVNNVINTFIGTSFDAWTDYTNPTVKRYFGAYLGYKLPYLNNLPANNKFTTRVELAINGAPDTTSIPNNFDIYISNGQLSAFNSNFPISGKYSIYQDNIKPNVFKGNVYTDRALIIPVHANASLSQNVKGNIFYDNAESTAKIVTAIGSVKNLLTYTTQIAIANPVSGAVVDVEARAAIVSILTALRNVGIIEP